VNPSGWGLPSDNDNSISDVLREVTVPILSNSDCTAVYGSTITDNIVCIDSTGGKGTCSGDSGGPMNYVDGGRTVTRGIVSFGSSTGCETGYP
ncbi:trypsin-like serine protease, partial [Xanthomonas citri pv. citri]|nr:trypsin-like serine protease [Xanthomonas citri pv. citri]